MRLLAIALVVICLIFVTVPLYAETTTPDTNNGEKAKALYLNGEKAYKDGKLEVAILTWNKALELKPDSEGTKKALNKAKDELYQTTIDYCNGPGTKDLVTSFIKLAGVMSLIPEKTELKDKLQATIAKLSDDQKKAVKAYQEAAKLANAKDYDKAAQSAALADSYAPKSEAIGKLIELIKNLQAKDASSSSNSVENNGRPKMLVFGAQWCAPCQKMKPIVEELKSEYKGRVDIVYIDVDSPSHKELLQKHPIKGIPLLVVIDKSGNEVINQLGEVSKDQLVAELSKVVVK